MRSLMMAFCLFLALPAFAEVHSIMVNGVAEKSLEPDLISLNVEVWSQAATAKKAQQMAAGEYQKVKKTFDSFKIKKEDISTQDYNLNPEYVYDQKTRQNKMTGFRVSQTLAVTLRKTDEAGAFLDALSSTAGGESSGVNLNNIQWDSSQRASAEMAGLAEAVRDARKKADEMAKAAGVRVKAVLHLAHNTSVFNPPAPRHGVFKKSIMAMDAAPATELSAGQIKMHVDVQAEYEIN